MTLAHDAQVQAILGHVQDYVGEEELTRLAASPDITVKDAPKGTKNTLLGIHDATYAGLDAVSRDLVGLIPAAPSSPTFAEFAARADKFVASLPE